MILRKKISLLFSILCFSFIQSCASSSDIKKLQVQIDYNRKMYSNLMAKTDSSDQKINAIGNTVSMVYDDVSTLHDQIANIKSQYKYKDQHLENEIQRAMDLYDQEFQALYEKYEPIFQKLDAFEKLLESYTTESGLKIYHLKGQSKTGIKIE